MFRARPLPRQPTQPKGRIDRVPAQTYRFLRMDFELPETHRQLSRRLMDLQSYDEIAEQIRVPKTRLYQIKLEAGRLLTSCMEKG